MVFRVFEKCNDKAGKICSGLTRKSQNAFRPFFMQRKIVVKEIPKAAIGSA
jgi:hypothetical protein